MQVFASLDNGDPNPFDLVTPTKNNFANIPAAIEYYQIRLDVCVKATALLKQAATLCTKVVVSTMRTAEAFAQLRPEDLDGYEVPDALRPAQLWTFSEKLEAIASTFKEAAGAYHAQAELLERTIEALRRGMLEVIK